MFAVTIILLIFVYIKQRDMIQVEKLNEQEAKWYGVTKDHKLISVEGENWFPTKKIAGVNSVGRYFDKHNLGLVISGNMGSGFVAVKDVEKAKKLLNQ